MNIICSLSDPSLKSGAQTSLDWALRQCCLCSAVWPYRPSSWSVGLRSHKSMMALGTRDTPPSYWFVLSPVGSLMRQMEILPASWVRVGVWSYCPGACRMNTLVVSSYPADLRSSTLLGVSKPLLLRIISHTE